MPNLHRCNSAISDPGQARRRKQSARSISNTGQQVEYTHEHELHQLVTAHAISGRIIKIPIAKHQLNGELEDVQEGLVPVVVVDA